MDPAFDIKSESSLSSPVVFSLFHIVAHMNYSLKFCGTPNIYFVADLTKIR